MANEKGFIDNEWNGGRRHVDVLRELAGDSVGVVKIATGFVSPKGLVPLAEATEGREVWLLVGDLRTLQGANHSSDDVKRVLAWVRQPNVRVKALFKTKPVSWNMHAKVWVFENSAVVSSANLTGGGLGLASDAELRQPELGVIARSQTSVEWLDGWFDKMWGQYSNESQRLEQLLVKEADKTGVSTTDAPSDGCFPSLVMVGLLPTITSAAIYVAVRVRQILKSQSSDSVSQSD